MSKEDRLCNSEISSDTASCDFEESDSEEIVVNQTNDAALPEWPESKKKPPVVLFTSDAIFNCRPEMKTIGVKYHLSYKMVKTESKLIRSVFAAHGFQEVNASCSEFNLMWTGAHPKIYGLRNLEAFQKVNHFPRSYEITRKDRLYKNVQKMQGFKGFDFLPLSFILPTEFDDFTSAFLRDKGVWIVKPIASSRGRGIYLVNYPEQVPTDENLLVSRYINNPLLVNGYKFDLRVYVAVTSFDPLIIYLYEDGLTRFATVKYNGSPRFMKNKCMHLTNYSLNKKSRDYVRCNDPAVDDYGNKWSMSALLRFLKVQGTDTTALMMRIEDVIIKTIISAESPISNAYKMYIPHRWNCFELFGFDILIDENLKPWVLEVNLSPSLNCDSPLDTRIKSNMISDLLSLIGIVAHDPVYRKISRKTSELHYRKCRSQKVAPGRPFSGLKTKLTCRRGTVVQSAEEYNILQRVKNDYKRRGGFIRVFPTYDSWQLYGHYFEAKCSHSRVLHQYLFSDNCSNKCISSLYTLLSRPWNPVNVEQMVSMKSSLPSSLEKSLSNISKRVKQYTRKKAYSTSICSLTKMHCKREIVKNFNPISNELAKDVVESKLGLKDYLSQLDVQRSFKDFRINPSPKTIVYDFLSLIDRGYELSKYQVRRAFSLYLQRVDWRLAKEINRICQNIHYVGSTLKRVNDQMNLIFWFLKKASTSLSEPLRVNLPVKELPLLDKHQLLNKQIKKFIQIYDADTLAIRQKSIVEDIMSKNESNEFSISGEKFLRFLDYASESQLENLLMRYIKTKKSMNGFLYTCGQVSPYSKPNAFHRQKLPLNRLNLTLFDIDDKKSTSTGTISISTQESLDGANSNGGDSLLDYFLNSESYSQTSDSDYLPHSQNTERLIAHCKPSSEIAHLVRVQLENMMEDISKRNLRLQFDSIEKWITKNPHHQLQRSLSATLAPKDPLMDIRNFNSFKDSLETYGQEKNNIVRTAEPGLTQSLVKFQNQKSQRLSDSHMSMQQSILSNKKKSRSSARTVLRPTIHDDISSYDCDLFSHVINDQGLKHVTTCQF